MLYIGLPMHILYYMFIHSPANINFLYLYITAILRVISAVLMFGNMTFKQEQSRDQATMPDDTGKL